MILQIPTWRAHIWFLLWHLLCGRPSVGKSSPPYNGHFTDYYCESSPTLTADMWQTKCRQIYPHRMVILQITTVRAYLLWQLLCGRPSVGRSTPTRMAISQIATLRAHLLWQIICGRLIIGRSSLQSNDFTNTYSEISYLIPTLDSSYVADQV